MKVWHACVYACTANTNIVSSKPLRVAENKEPAHAKSAVVFHSYSHGRLVDVAVVSYTGVKNKILPDRLSSCQALSGFSLCKEQLCGSEEPK